MKKLFNEKTFIVVLIMTLALLLLSSQLFLLKSKFSITPSQKDSLISAAAKALQTNDVPVGCIIIYNGEVIGTGFNTVLHDGNTAGHAEINAMNDAVQKIGFKKFAELNRDSLFLITSFEPCMMCRGAIIEYNIKNIVFMKSKGLMHWLKKDAKEFRYEWYKSKTSGDALQDSLFELHPDYPGK